MRMTCALIPRPVQSPHPPVRVAANSPETFPFAARRGLPIFAAPLINPPERLKAGLQAYRETLPAGIKGDTALAFSAHVTTSRAQARQDTRRASYVFLREAAERLRPVGQADIRSFEAFRQVLARIERVRYEDVESEMAIFGDPDYCVERVQALRREYGMDEFICYFKPGRDHGPRHGQAIDDAVRPRGHAALPLAGVAPLFLPQRIEKFGPVDFSLC